MGQLCREVPIQRHGEPNRTNLKGRLGDGDYFNHMPSPQSMARWKEAEIPSTHGRCICANHHISPSNPRFRYAPFTSGEQTCRPAVARRGRDFEDCLESFLAGMFV